MSFPHAEQSSQAGVPSSASSSLGLVNGTLGMTGSSPSAAIHEAADHHGCVHDSQIVECSSGGLSRTSTVGTSGSTSLDSPLKKKRVEFLAGNSPNPHIHQQQRSPPDAARQDAEDDGSAAMHCRNVRDVLGVRMCEFGESHTSSRAMQRAVGFEEGDGDNEDEEEEEDETLFDSAQPSRMSIGSGRSSASIGLEPACAPVAAAAVDVVGGPVHVLLPTMENPSAASLFAVSSAVGTICDSLLSISGGSMMNASVIEPQLFPSSPNLNGARDMGSANHHTPATTPLLFPMPIVPSPSMSSIDAPLHDGAAFSALALQALQAATVHVLASEIQPIARLSQLARSVLYARSPATPGDSSSLVMHSNMGEQDHEEEVNVADELGVFSMLQFPPFAPNTLSPYPRGSSNNDVAVPFRLTALPSLRDVSRVLASGAVDLGCGVDDGDADHEDANTPQSAILSQFSQQGKDTPMQQLTSSLARMLGLSPSTSNHTSHAAAASQSTATPSLPAHWCHAHDPVSDGAVTTLFSIAQLESLVANRAVEHTRCSGGQRVVTRLEPGESVAFIIHYGRAQLRQVLNESTKRVGDVRVFTLNVATLPAQEANLLVNMHRLFHGEEEESSHEGSDVVNVAATAISASNHGVDVSAPIVGSNGEERESLSESHAEDEHLLAAVDVASSSLPTSPLLPRADTGCSVAKQILCSMRAVLRHIENVLQLSTVTAAADPHAAESTDAGQPSPSTNSALPFSSNSAGGPIEAMTSLNDGQGVGAAAAGSPTYWYYSRRASAAPPSLAVSLSQESGAATEGTVSIGAMHASARTQTQMGSPNTATVQLAAKAAAHESEMQLPTFVFWKGDAETGRTQEEVVAHSAGKGGNSLPSAGAGAGAGSVYHSSSAPVDSCKSIRVDSPLSLLQWCNTSEVTPRATFASCGTPLVVKQLHDVSQLHSLSLLRPVYTISHLMSEIAKSLEGDGLWRPRAALNSAAPSTLSSRHHHHHHRWKATSASTCSSLASSRTLIYLGASWCPPCMRIVGALPEMLTNDMPSAVSCAVKADMDFANPIFELFGVEIIPTFVVLDNNKLQRALELLESSSSSFSDVEQQLGALVKAAMLGAIQNSQRPIVRTFIDSHCATLTFDDDF